MTFKAAIGMILKDRLFACIEKKSRVSEPHNPDLDNVWVRLGVVIEMQQCYLPSAVPEWQDFATD